MKKEQRLLERLISRIDFFGEPPKLQIMKKEKFTTSLGFFLTLSISAVCVLFLVLQLETLLTRSNPSVIVSEQQSLSSDPFLLQKHNFTLAIVLGSVDLAGLGGINKHFTITVRNCHRKRLVDPLTGLTRSTQNCTVFPTEPCSLEKHFTTPYQKKYFAKMELQYVHCVNSEAWDRQPLALQGSLQADDYQYLTIQVNLCNNSTNLSTCASLEESKKHLLTGFYGLHLHDTLTKMDMPDSPYEQIISLQFAALSSQRSRQVTSFLKQLQTISDDGLIVENLLEQIGLSQSIQKESEDIYNGQYMIYHQIVLETRKMTYQRSYIKVQGVLSQVGGLWQILILLCSIAMRPITSTLMHIRMANKIFSFESNGETFDDDGDSSKAITTNMNPESKRGAAHSKNPTSLKHKHSASKKQFKMNLRQIILMLWGCKKLQAKQLSYATNKIMAKLDVQHIVSKIYEIDKLKHVLLTEDQLNLLDYIPKPAIPQEMFKKDYQDKIHELEDTQQYRFILQEEKSSKLKLELAQKSYNRLIKKENRSYVDQQLLDMLDNQITYLFKRIYLGANRMRQVFEPDVRSEFTSPKEHNNHFPSVPEQEPDQVIVIPSSRVQKKRV